jgi:hypothetical protein
MNNLTNNQAVAGTCRYDFGASSTGIWVWPQAVTIRIKYKHVLNLNEPLGKRKTITPLFSTYANVVSENEYKCVQAVFNTPLPNAPATASNPFSFTSCKNTS